MTNLFMDYLQSQGLTLKDPKGEPRIYFDIDKQANVLAHESLVFDYLDKVCRYYFSESFKGTVRASNRFKSTNGQFSHKRPYKGDKRDLSVLEISYSLKLEKNRLENTLKHELIHYYCFIKGLDFKDGQDTFEHGLSYVKATSTRTNGVQALSSLVQSSSEKGRRLYGMDGITLGKPSDLYNNIVKGTYYQGGTVQSIAVRLNGETVGHIVRACHRLGGQWDYSTLDMIVKGKYFKTRKDAIGVVVEQHLAKVGN